MVDTVTGDYEIVCFAGSGVLNAGIGNSIVEYRTTSVARDGFVTENFSW